MTKPVPVHRLGIWWFLGSEIVVFGGLIVSYLLMRLHHPEWGLEAAHTLTWVGATNTVILLTSSLTVILAHQGYEKNNLIKARQYMGITILLGLCFLSFKAYEYSHEIHHGLLPSKSLFWSFYYLMTGLHGLHIIGGLVANAVVFQGLKKGENPQRVESVGLYWHFVDVVWIYLFPLLYIASSGGAK